MQVSADNFVKVLNEALKIDPEAVNKIFQNKVPCKRELIDHPTIIIGGSNEAPTLSALGIINGAFVAGDRIGAAWNDQNPDAPFIEEFVIVSEENQRETS